MANPKSEDGSSGPSPSLSTSASGLGRIRELIVGDSSAIDGFRARIEALEGEIGHLRAEVATLQSIVNQNTLRDKTLAEFLKAAAEHLQRDPKL